MSLIASIRLHYHEGSSDKVYHIELVQVAGGYLVNFQYGRRGGTLTAGTKTEHPVPLADAQKRYTRLIADKTAKGYRPILMGVVTEPSPASLVTPSAITAHPDTEPAGRATGFVPQLLNPISDAEALGLIHSPYWAAQEKMDGERRAVHANGTTAAEITGINRKGLSVPLPTVIIDALSALVSRHGALHLDGELIGDTLHVFDLHRHGDIPLQAAPWHQRIALVQHLLGDCPSNRVIPVAYTTEAKRTLWHQVKQAKGEGVVFKRLASPVTPGRPNSGGDWLKCKFTASASCVVTDLTPGKRSVRIGLLQELPRTDGDQPFIPVGKVTIPINHPIPAVGTVIEVNYLYAYRQGCLFQPVYRGRRPDLATNDCTLRQLKYKPSLSALAGEDTDSHELAA